jgi:hypothetical protein
MGTAAAAVDDNPFARAVAEVPHVFDVEVRDRLSPRLRLCLRNTDEQSNGLRAEDVEAEMGYMESLVRDHRRGALEPQPVRLPLPDNASRTVRRVAQDLEFLFGLRAELMDDRPMPYACRWRAKELRLSHMTVHRALEVLVECGAIVKCDYGAPAFGRLVATGMYLPGR